MTARFLSLGLACLAAATLQAEVTLPALFSDHMVLQTGKADNIWGKASPGEKVSVEFQGKTYTAEAGSDGCWSTKLDAAQKGGPFELVVKGTNEIRIKDVLVGEVWLCSGQSNMAMHVDGLHGTVDRAAEEIAIANHPQLRLFTYDHLYDIYQLEVPPREPQTERTGRWWVCSPETVAHFSAMGYFVGRELQKQLDSPVGMIISAVGGTPIEAWTSLPAQKANPALQPVLDSWQKEMTGYDPAADLAKYNVAKEAWLKERTALTKDGKPIPKAPLPFKNRQVMEPAGLFNGLINPIVGYTIRGVLWYQGERNGAGPLTQFYGKQMETLIKDWRALWKDDFYFAWVQLPNYQKPTTAPVQDKGWGVWVRDGQRTTLALPSTGMAITMDLGGETAGHPTNKQAYADRLAKVVLHDVYKKDIPFWSGPLFQSAQRDGDKMVITFAHADGLKAADGELKGFAIAGADKKWIGAKATVENGKVVVSGNGLTEPVAVRYAWAANPDGNLRNGGDLPASPFRTDDWQ